MKQKHEAEGKELSTHSQKKTVLIRSILVTTVILALLVGLSYAWLFSRSNIATLVSISPPSPIAIKGAHGEALTALDLSYTDDDKKDGKVTIRRVISVSSSAAKHKLEIVHTTNLKGLTFKIYRAEESNQISEGASSVIESSYTYTYDSSKSVDGKYINQQSESNEYKYANNSQHSKNYAEGDTVQIHAEPLYWVSGELAADKNNKDLSDEDGTANLTYYVLEISWTETTKETDIFYVLAKEE